MIRATDFREFGKSLIFAVFSTNLTASIPGPSILTFNTCARTQITLKFATARKLVVPYSRNLMGLNELTPALVDVAWGLDCFAKSFYQSVCFSCFCKHSLTNLFLVNYRLKTCKSDFHDLDIHNNTYIS